MFLQNLSLETTTNCQQQGERANLKTGVTRKQSINFSKNEHFLPVDQGVRNVRFSKNLACFASL